MKPPTKRIAFATLVAAVFGFACDPGSIPNRNVNDVSHEVRTLNATNHQVVVRNPNGVRVGAEFKLRIYREGQRPPIREQIEHVYVAPRMEHTISVDLSDLCDPDAAPVQAAGEPAPAAAATAPAAAGSGDGTGEGSGPGDAPEAATPPARPACGELSVHATLLQTYWLADE